MSKKALFLKKIATLFFLLFTIAAFSQTVGDFRSNVTTGSWTDSSSWQTYDGTAWVAATSYPGQNAGTYSVTVQTGHTILITTNLVTQAIGTVTVNGTLNLGSLNDTSITLSTLNLEILGGTLHFVPNKIRLFLPADSVIKFKSGGTIIADSCNNLSEVYIGGSVFAACAGAPGNIFTFQQLLDSGGTIDAILSAIANPIVICPGNSVSFTGKYSGAIGTEVTYVWTVKDSSDNTVVLNSVSLTGNLANTTAETTISFIPLTTDDYTVTFTVTTNLNGTLYTNTATVTFRINIKNSWTGAVSNDWNTLGNWCSNIVPSSSFTYDVVIPATATRPAILGAGDFGVVKNILVENGATLTLVDNYLKVNDTLTLNGKIDLNGESQLIQATNSILDVASTGTIEIDQQGTGNSFRYNYWSSPVNSSVNRNSYTIGDVLKDGTTSTYQNITFGNPYTFADGATTTPIQLSSYWMYVFRNSAPNSWTSIGNTGSITVGEGYTMKGSNTSALEQNYTFVGKPNNGIIELNIGAGNEYLVGNPYPSAIDAYQFLLDNSPSGTASIAGAIYFWEHFGGDSHNLRDYMGGYATYNLSGSTAPAAAFPGLGGGVSAKGAPQPFITVGQAFLVMGDVDGGQIQFKNGQRVFKRESLGEAVFMKNSGTKAKTVDIQNHDLRPKFRIGFDAPKISHRQLLLTVDERATPEVDWGFDAEIYQIFADDMYWLLNNKKYVILGTNKEGLNSDIPLGIQLSKTGMVTFKIDALENVDDSIHIYLKDKLKGEYFDMRQKPVQLNLTEGNYTNRFALSFQAPKLVAEDVVAEVLIPATAQPIIEGIHVFMNNTSGELQIKNNSTEEIVSVALVNTLGQTIKTWNSNFNIRTISLPLSTATGIYLVQINTKTGKTVKKISVE